MLTFILANYETALSKLSNAEIQIEDLKLQLDDALGAEEMLVQLTERNLHLGEKIEEMRITIEDLEALKELNDELEENHMETEKAMQEDLGQCHVCLLIHEFWANVTCQTTRICRFEITNAKWSP